MNKEEYLSRVMKILIGYNKAFPYKVEEETLGIWGKMLVKNNFKVEDLKKNCEIALMSEKSLSYADLVKDHTPKVDVVEDIFRGCGYSSKIALEKFGIAGMKVWNKYGQRFRYDNNTTRDYAFMLKNAQKMYDDLVADRKVNSEHYKKEEIRYKKMYNLEVSEEENQLYMNSFKRIGDY